VVCKPVGHQPKRCPAGNRGSNRRSTRGRKSGLKFQRTREAVAPRGVALTRRKPPRGSIRCLIWFPPVRWVRLAGSWAADLVWVTRRWPGSGPSTASSRGGPRGSGSPRNPRRPGPTLQQFPITITQNQSRGRQRHTPFSRTQYYESLYDTQYLVQGPNGDLEGKVLFL
jgi:hypothetical protein